MKPTFTFDERINSLFHYFELWEYEMLYNYRLFVEVNMSFY